MFLAEALGWRQVRRERPRLAGGARSALRAYGEDEAARRRLGTDLAGNRRRADKRLPEITGLIDPAQFELITRAGGYLAIRGNAGSGKTTVALHRIAYLAYDDPEIDSDRTLFVVFSPALRDYVGTVLPSLGVESVRIVTYRDWAHEQRRRHFADLPAALRADTPAYVQRLKLDPALLEALARHVADHPGPADLASGARRLGQRADAPGALARVRGAAHAGRLSRGGVRSVRRLLPAPQRGAVRVARGRCGDRRAARPRGRCAAVARVAAARRAAARPQGSAAIPPRRDRRGAGLLPARGPGADRLPRRAAQPDARGRHAAARAAAHRLHVLAPLPRGARRGGRRARDAARELPLVAGDRDLRARPARQPARGGGSAARDALGSARGAVPLHRPRRVRRVSRRRAARARAQRAARLGGGADGRSRR